MKADGKGSVVLGGFQGLDKNPFGSVQKGPKTAKIICIKKGALTCIEKHTTKSPETTINKVLPRDSNSRCKKRTSICSEGSYTKPSESSLYKGISED